MDLSQEVTAVKGVGEKTAASLNKAGIFTVRDLLYFLPKDYENYQTAKKIADITPGNILVKAKVESINVKYTRRRNFTITEAVLADDTAKLRAVWFNQPYRTKQFDKAREYFFSGSYELKNGRYQLTSPSATLTSNIDPSSTIQPIYKAAGGIKSQEYRKFMNAIRAEFAKIPDLLPHATPKERADALYKSHFPETVKDTEDARKYLAYEEVYELLLAAYLSKQENQKLKAEKLPFNQQNTQNFVKSLPFTLTGAQKRAAWDILQDLGQETPMNRLLQGDVGSGKTIVAALAALQAIQNGAQVALLAPTAILASQHAEGLDELLRPLGVKIALLTGATKNKSTLKKQIREGNVDLIIGTHAIITDDTVFSNLAFCIIDEQHRFGVNQRQKLLLKTARNVKNNTFAPHLLAMTATPIPRSLQLTLFGDLDVSVINEMPKGRTPVKTQILKTTDMKERLYPKIREEITKKHQIYWICKSIDDNPQTETASVKRETAKLKKIFPKYRIAYLHGRMKPDEKDQIMQQFADDKLDILVSTTVVEVGVNVPNASLMVIQDAEGYGLAQLHQLRGRVGRGAAESFCFLVVGAEAEPSRRLRELEKSTNGFYLAEVDLKLRGPGEIYGSLQHGALDLRIATLSDTPLIAKASKAAKADAKEFSKNPDSMLKYKELMSGISHYQQLTTLN